MILPTIHLNGTAASDLYEQYSAAVNALREAEHFLAECSPNGRDYYTQGPDAIHEAIAEHGTRRLAIEEVRKQIEKLLAHVAEAL